MARTLDRYSKSVGPCFTVLPERIITSARKLRTYSGWELLSALIKVGSRGARSRSGMEIWYGPRRVDHGHEN